MRTCVAPEIDGAIFTPGKAPDPVGADETVKIATAADDLRRPRPDCLQHGPLRTACRAVTIGIEFDRNIADQVARTRRAVGVNLNKIFPQSPDRIHTAKLAPARDNTAAVKQRRGAHKIARVDQIGVASEKARNGDGGVGHCTTAVR